MAKSFLGAQLEEIPHLLDKIGPSLQKLAQVNAQVLSRKMGVEGAGGPSGGGGGVVLDASGRPIAPSSGVLGRSGSSSIEEFLRRLAEQSAADSNRAGGGPGGKGGAGGGSMLSAPIQATEGEKAAAKSLGETVEYLRKLMAAAKWAKIAEYTALRAPKGERDALIAAYEASVESAAMGSSSAGGSGNTVGPREVTSDNLGNYNTADANRGNTVVVGPYGGSPADHSSLAPLAHGAQSAKVGATPTAGDKLVAETVGGVTKAIEKLTAKIDNQGNLAFRTKGL